MPDAEKGALPIRPVTAHVRDDGSGFYFECPRCRFYKNVAPGPCRNVSCDGTVVRVEFRVFPPESGARDRTFRETSRTVGRNRTEIGTVLTPAERRREYGSGSERRNDPDAKCREVDMNANDLHLAAHRLRALYDGRGSHLATAYALEAEAKELETGQRATVSPLCAALATPYLKDAQ